MPAYRIYWLDQDNHITEGDWLIAEADDDVRAGAASYLSRASAVEVWHQTRRVVRGPTNKPVPAGRLIEVKVFCASRPQCRSPAFLQMCRWVVPRQPSRAGGGPG